LFSFYLANCKDKESKEAHLCKLDEIFKNTLIDSSTTVVISDASIKNNVATSISHIHSSLNNIKKIIHYAVNIILTEAELFAIRCKINQAVQISGASHIIIITNFIYSVKYIFVKKCPEILIYGYQLYLIRMSC